MVEPQSYDQMVATVKDGFPLPMKPSFKGVPQQELPSAVELQRRLAESGAITPADVNALLPYVVQQMDRMPVGDLLKYVSTTKSVTGGAKTFVQHAGPKFVQRFAERLAEEAGKHSPEFSIMAMTTLLAMGVRDYNVHGKLFNAEALRLDHVAQEPKRLVRLLSLASSAGYRARWAFEASAPLVERDVDKMHPSQLSRVITSYVGQHLVVPSLFDKLVDHAKLLLAEFDGRSLSNFATACVRTGWRTAEVLEFTGSRANELCGEGPEKFEQRDLANWIWSCAFAEPDRAEWFITMNAARLAKREFTPSSARLLITACHMISAHHNGTVKPESLLRPFLWQHLVEQQEQNLPQPSHFELDVAAALQGEKIPFKAGPVVGGMCLDFIVIWHGEQINLECDGHSFHNFQVLGGEPYPAPLDAARDRLVRHLGHKVARLGYREFREEPRKIDAVLRALAKAK